MENARDNRPYFFASVIALVLIGLAYWYWQHLTRYPSTENAYVQAHIVHISPKISGRVEKILVSNNHPVKQGETLFQIDSSDYQLAVDTAKANLRLAEQKISTLKQSVEIAKAKVKEKRAQLAQVELDAKRTADLAKQQLVPQAQKDSADTQVTVAKAALQAALRELEQAKTQVNEKDNSFAELNLAKAQLEQAELNLQETQIKAPASGVVSHLSLRPGDFVQPGQNVFALVDHSQWWVDANFKETQLTYIRANQPASIEVDLYPGTTLSGKVESISDGSGSTFSLLPAENATGNWVKVTQRFQVRVTLDTPPQDTPLRVGASASVTIDTQS